MDIPTVSRSAPSRVLQATEMVGSQVPQAGSGRGELKGRAFLWVISVSSIFLCVIKVFDGNSSHPKVERPHLSIFFLFPLIIIRELMRIITKKQIFCLIIKHDFEIFIQFVLFLLPYRSSSSDRFVSIKNKFVRNFSGILCFFPLLLSVFDATCYS